MGDLKAEHQKLLFLALEVYDGLKTFYRRILGPLDFFGGGP